LNSIYYFLPYYIRRLAAGTMGYFLSKRRYTQQTESLVAEILERDYWTTTQWQEWTQIQLAHQLENAATHCPYYRQQWVERRKRGDRASWVYLENWPILNKDAVRENPGAFLVDYSRKNRFYEEHTSGTSGTPLTLWRSKDVEKLWYAQFEARVRYWNGVSRFDRWAILGGQLVVSVRQKKPPYWVWNGGMKQLYCSVYHLSPQTGRYYVEAIKAHQVDYLLGYPSALAGLAQMIVEQGLPTSGIKVVLTNAEMLLPAQREMIQKAFGCPVMDTYGMAELAAAGSECEYQVMHLWPDTGVVEVFNDGEDQPLPTRETGRLICTSLLNTSMPFIRYQVGDRGALASEDFSCACGRRLPALLHIDGRLDHVILTPDGRRVGRLDPVFKADLAIHEAQIIQEELAKIRVRVVPASGYTKKSEVTIQQRVQERLGEVQVIVEPVERIERGKNGKFIAVISKLDEKNPATHKGYVDE